MFCLFDMSDFGTSESAAKKGMLAGAFLAVIEVTGGLLSGSLGLLSSSFNTLMDFVSTIIMFFAVREGNKPPDEIHMYGHEKIESAAAISEILLLFVACSWISYNAFLRLASGWSGIEVFWLALVTNFASILIDAFAYLKLKASSRSRESEAIEAGALHFMNDLLIALIVIAGLVSYWFGVWSADSIAALCIVVYIAYSGLRVVRDSFTTLMDAAPKGVSKRVKEQIVRVEGVEDCHHLRIRRAGPKYFVDTHVTLAGGMPLYQAHTVASNIEEQIASVLPGSDIVIHTEPHTGGDPLATVRGIASQIPEVRDIHGIAVKSIGRNLFLSYHLELEPSISVKDAHEIASSLEQHLKNELKNVSTIISHLEPASEISESGYSPEKDSTLRRQIARIADGLPEVRSLHEVQIITRDGRRNITLHCSVDGLATLAQSHEIATKIEERVRAIDKQIVKVSVHCEPEDSS